MKPGIHNFLFLVIIFLLSLSVNANPIEGNLVEIKILDKITARVETVEINVNDHFLIDSLKLEIYACYKNPPEEIPENFVLLKIYDNINNKLENKLIYQGWMISSSPASTPLEHPIYDLWLKDCKVNMVF
jgi:hypothetical protein|tara:strand:+ start:150 stop:539 length:390 start_codon:yes stop_codon:yes gene_type:complete